MVTVTFEEVVCRKLGDTNAQYRLVLPADGDGQGELKSAYRHGVDVVGWTNPLKISINMAPSNTSIRISLDLRRKARMTWPNAHGRNMCSYSLDLDSDCKSRDVIFQVSPSPNGITNPPEIHATITVTGIAKAAARRIDVEFDAIDHFVNSSPLPPQLDTSAPGTTSGDLANVESLAVPRSAADPSGEVTHSAPAPLAGDVPLATQLDAAQGATRDASDQQARLRDRELPLSVLAGNDAASDIAAGGAATWDAAQSVKFLVEVLDDFAEIHPIANAAWKIITLAYKLKEQQSQTDEEAERLVKSMDANCRLAAVLVKNELASTTVSILRNILEAVSNGATVVEQYCRIRQSFLSSFKLVGSTIASRIKTCLEVLDTLQRELGGHTIANIQHDLQTVTSTLSQNHNDLLVRLKRLDEDLMERKSRRLLGDMVYAAKADRDLHDDDRGCLLETRVEIIQAIVDWATGDPSGDSNSYIRGLNPSSRVLWLCGVAGSGKSSIAISVARALRSKNPPQLCALYGFETAYQESLNPKSLFSTIARQRADRRPAQKRHLLHVLEQMDRDQRATTSVPDQFRCFLTSTSTVGVDTPDDVIVIDAFDESGTVSQRAAILLALSPEPSSPTFPQGVRFIITSRYEPDVAQRLESVAAGDWSQCSVLRMEDIHPEHTERDIEKYVTHMLDGTYGLEVSRAAGDLARLAVTAEHSFQWASTACRYIIDNNDHDGARLPDERLNEMLETRGGLDNLYLSILDQSFKESISRESPATRSLRMVLGTLVCALEPASIQIIAALASANLSVQTVNLTRFHILARKLSSIVTGTQTTSTPLVAFHTSFTDFLADGKRSEPYAVDASEMHVHLALASLAVMAKSLRFNICCLETSFLRNDAVPDLAERIRKHIPDELSYACRFWPVHVAAALASTTANAEALQDSFFAFLESKSLLLQWLEVMSLTGMNAYESLGPLLSLQAGNRDLSDLITFTTYFSVPIGTSIPHIYLSALAFAPASSLIITPVSTHFPNLVHSAPPLTSWPQIRHTFTHPSEVYCVTFSPNGRWVVSGAESGEISVWDMYSGSMILPQMSASGAISSIAISQDGSLLASGSDDGTIQLWNMCTLSSVGEPVKAHTRGVWSVTFSPDGKLLASGSSDNTIRLWELQSRIATAKASATIETGLYSLTFSPDGNLLALASSDGTVRLWDVHTLSPVGEPLTGHPGWVRSLVFSPDGALLVSGSSDGTIRCWDTDAQSVIGEPLTAHDSYIHSVIFSPDGKTLASCSDDKTVRLWNVQNRSLVGKPLTGHTGPVVSIAFSPDGALLASGSSDKTVHIWDARVLAVNREYPVTQFKIQTFAAFSPDGKLLASGSYGYAIQIWDVHSVSPVGEPLKGHTGDIRSVAFSPDGTLLASGSNDETVRLWDVRTGLTVGEPLRGHSDAVWTLAFSPDSKILASGSLDDTIRFWDTHARSASGEPLAGPSRPVMSLAFSPDGNTLASGDYGGTVRLWDVQTCSLIGQALKGHSDWVRCLVFSPDGTLLASGSNDETVRLWNVRTQSTVGEPFEGHTDAATSLAFSPEGALLASSSQSENVVRVWDVRAPSEVGEPVALLRHETDIFSIAFPPTSSVLSSITRGGVVREWDLRYLLSASSTNLLRNPKERLEEHTSSMFPDHPDLSALPPNFPLNLDDGWVIGPKGEPVLWIPPALRPSIDDVRVVARFGGPPHVKLDFAHFASGSDWADCYSPSSVSTGDL